MEKPSPGWYGSVLAVEGLLIFLVAGFFALMFPLACLENAVGAYCDGPWWSLAMLLAPTGLFVAMLLLALTYRRWVWLLVVPMPSVLAGMAVIFLLSEVG